MRISDSDLRHFLLWMDNATQDAQGAEEDRAKLTKVEKSDLKALKTAKELVNTCVAVDRIKALLE